MGAILSAAATGVAASPWQFSVNSYGAKGDVKIITDATITTGTNLLNSTSQAQFTSADIGKYVLVSCAGGGTYSPLGQVTITGVNSLTQAVLSANASSTTPGASICAYGTDDTAAIQKAVNDANTYALAHNGYGEIVFGNQLYGLGGTTTPVNRNAGQGNALITLPLVAATKQKVLLSFVAGSRGYDQALMHWLQTTPQAAGSVLVCLRTDGTSDGTFGPSFCVGGPINGYGNNLGLFTNIMPVVDGVQIVVPYNSTYGGWDFFGCAEGIVPNGSCMAMAVPPAAPPYPNITNPNNISNTWAAGVRMPCTGNNDRCDIDYFSAEGLCYGIEPSEHSVISAVRAIYCITGVEFYNGPAGNMAHACKILYASCEANTNGLGTRDGTVYADIDVLDIESSVLLFDPNSYLSGTLYGRGNGSVGFGAFTINGGTAVKVINQNNAQGTVTMPTAPANNTAWQNTYNRDLWITLSATTITAVTIKGLRGTGGAVTQAIPSGATTYAFHLVEGASYTPTYTGTLTHTGEAM